MRRFTAVPLLLLVFSALGVVVAPPAFAAPPDPTIESTTPADGSSVQNNPAPPAGPVISATFDVALDQTMSTITVKDKTGTELSGTTSFPENDTIAFTPSADLSEAGSPYTVSYHAVRQTLVLLTTDDDFTFRIDNTAPVKPSITSIEADTTSPATANDTTPTIVVGDVVAGDTVRIFDATSQRGSKVVPNGVTSVTFNALEGQSEVTITGADGTHPISATATDAAGNVSEASTVFQYILDTTGPTAPTIGSVAGDSLTPATANDATPLIVVNGAVVGDTVKIFDGGVEKAAKLATGTSVFFNEAETGEGSSEVEVVGDGAHTLTARAVDPYGNSSTASPGFVYNFDSTPPAVPSITSVSGDTTSPAAGSDTTPPIVVGGVVAGDTVRIFEASVLMGSKVVPNGFTSVTFNQLDSATEVVLSGIGDHPLTATSVDPVGNQSAASATFVYSLDNAGAPPQVVSTSPVDGSTGPEPATVSAVYSEALNTASSTLVLKNNADNSVAGAVTFSGDAKTIIFTPGTALTEVASPYTATATVSDPEGNVADATVWTFSVDTTAPPAPTIASVAGDTETPATGSDTTPTILVTGVTEGDTVKIFDGATEKGSKVVAAGEAEVLFNGGADADVTLSGDGSKSLTAKAVDPATNVSAASTAFEYVLDATAPAAPSITSVEGDTATPATGTDDTPAVVVGGVVAGDTVKIFDGADEIASKAVPTSATSVTFNATESDAELTVTGDGAHVLKANATDAAGNASADSATFTYTLDTTGPVLVSTSPADGATVAPPATASAAYGEALDQTNSTITVTKTGGAAVAGATSFSGDGKTIIFTPTSAFAQADGPFAVTVAAQDALGNTTNSAFSFAVDSTPPAAPTIDSVEGDATTPASGQDATPTIVVSGLVEGDTVKVFEGATEKGSKVVPGGATSVTFNALESDAEVTVSGAGGHTLTAKAVDPPGNVSAASGAFVYTLVVPITPTITEVDPPAGPRDTEGLVFLTGTNFTEDAVVSFSGTGITVDDTLLESASSLIALVTIDAAAPLGARDVTVSIPGNNSATCVGCFTVMPAQGYTLVGTDGGVFNFGTSMFHGSTGSTPLNAPVIGIAHTPTGNGYWLVAEDGGIFSYGDAVFHGSTGSMELNAPVLGMEPTPTGGGYWLFAADGGIFSFGDAVFHGSMGSERLNAPVIGMAATSTGSGYWLVAEDGGIFSFGDAVFHGSTGSLKLVEPVFDMAARPDGSGYWLVARDGGVFAFDAPFFGSAAGDEPGTVIGMGATPSGNGYWIADEFGFVYPYGDAAFLGDLEDFETNEPIIGFAVMPASAG